MTKLTLRTRADCPELKRAAMVIEQASWNALGFLNYTRAHFQFYNALLEEFPEYQLCLVDEANGYPVAVGNCVPLACDMNDLPPEGWDWIVETAAKADQPRNTIGALAISVPAVHRAKGYARMMIQAFQALSKQKGYSGVIAPVRPSAKAKHPNVPIEDYINWIDDQGRAYDPWLRSHLSAGGRIVGPCARSMVVEEPVAFWETWTQRQFERAGEYAVPGALAPVKIDGRIGRYEEPNVWFAYAN